jgi:lysophospholipase L1-like esterase
MGSHRQAVPLIVCFGDSLTAGYQSPTPDAPDICETPYGRFLQDRLGSRARVVVSGICGEVTGEMAMRFRQDVLVHAPAFVVILGGTNDLGMNARPVDIMRNLVKLYESALAVGVQPVAVTVPSFRVDALPDDRSPDRLSWVTEFLARRLTLNGLIADYCARHRIAVVDLFTATAEPETRLLAPTYSNDGLHLTTEGYRLLAALLYDRVFAPALSPA